MSVTEFDLDEDQRYEESVDRNIGAMLRFFFRVEDDRIADPEGCWNWPGAITSTTGYGRVNVGAKQYDTHRYAWMLLCGPIPADREVCHHCDNRRCVNTKHLFLGTRSDNMRDARNKGRIAGQKLQRGQIPLIRAAIAAGEHRALVAARFGVDPRTVSSIVSGKTWSDV